MLVENKSKIVSRFLTAVSRFSQEAIGIWKNESRIRCRGKKIDESFNEFQNWQETESEIGLFTMYAYADFKIPKSFNCIFDFNNPERCINTKMILKQSIWEGWYPINNVDHGHKHLMIFQFEKEIPEIISELHVERKKYLTIPKNSINLGICQLTDYDLIRENQLKIRKLRKLYGSNWSEYYDY